MIALERANLPVDRYVAYEVDEYAIEVSKKNYPNIEHKGNVFDSNFLEYTGFDLLIGGSPCTYWSLARSSKAEINRETVPEGLGWELFKKYVEALNNSKCKYFLYENNFSISKDIQNEITKYLGVKPLLINSELVSAQRRKRLYWTNIPNVQQPENKNIDLQSILDTDDNYLKSFKVKRTPSRERMWNNGNGREKGVICCDNITYKNKSGTVTSKQDRNYNAGLIKYEDFCRYLTINEQERLQTLPTNYTYGIPDSKRTICIGNGWTVDVIAHILKYIK